MTTARASWRIAPIGVLVLVAHGCRPLGPCLPDGHPPFLDVDARVSAADLEEAGIADPATATTDQCRAVCFAIAAAETDWYVAGPASVTECALSDTSGESGDTAGPTLDCRVELGSPPCK